MSDDNIQKALEYDESESSHSDFMNLDFKNQFTNSSQNRQSKGRVAASLIANKQREMFANENNQQNLLFSHLFHDNLPIQSSLLNSHNNSQNNDFSNLNEDSQQQQIQNEINNQTLKSINYEKSHSKNQQDELVQNIDMDIRDFDQLQIQNNTDNEIQNNQSLREINSEKENEQSNQIEYLQNEEFNEQESESQPNFLQADSSHSSLGSNPWIQEHFDQSNILNQSQKDNQEDIIVEIQMVDQPQVSPKESFDMQNLFENKIKNISENLIEELQDYSQKKDLIDLQFQGHFSDSENTNQIEKIIKDSLQNYKQQNNSSSKNSESSEQKSDHQISDQKEKESDQLKEDNIEDIDENQENEAEKISEDSLDKLQNMLNTINDSCIASLKTEDTEQALEQLKKAESILEEYTNDGKEIDRNMIIIILYNQACCYQRLSMLEECSNYLDATIFNLKQNGEGFDDWESEFKQIKKLENLQPQKDQDFGLNQNDYGYPIIYGKDDNQDDFFKEQSPKNQISNDDYGLQKQINKQMNYGANTQIKQKRKNLNQTEDDLKSVNSYPSQDLRALNKFQDPVDGSVLMDSSQISHLQNSKKLSISQKLQKLRQLCKCHLQLCAVQSQLNKHRDALHHGQMASVYCQELIKNSLFLSESYIGEIFLRAQELQKNEDKQNDISVKLIENYYIEDDKHLLQMLIQNCQPILRDLLNQIEKFNKYNQIEKFSGNKEIYENQNKFNEFNIHSTSLNIVQNIDEFNEELMHLLENKDQLYSINKETAKNHLKFVEVRKEIEELVKAERQQNQQLNNLIIMGLAENQEEEILGKRNHLFFTSNELMKGPQKSSRNNLFDEMAPNQVQRFSLSKIEKNQDFSYQNNNLQSFDPLLLPAFEKQQKIYSDLLNTSTDKESNKKQQLAGNIKSSYLNLRSNVKNLLVTQEEDDWIFNLNIGNVMHLQPLSSEEMNLHIDNSHELSRDAILEKIILLTVSYFCVGTELRFLNNSSQSNSTDEAFISSSFMKNSSISYKERLMAEKEKEKKRKKEQSEMWHAQALESSSRFLPSECPLVAHVITNYQKHHSPALTTIPEDEILDEDLRVVRPLNEVKNDNINYYQIIRNHLRPIVNKLAPVENRLSNPPEPNLLNREPVQSPSHPQQNLLDYQQANQIDNANKFEEQMNAENYNDSDIEEIQLRESLKDNLFNQDQNECSQESLDEIMNQINDQNKIQASNINISHQKIDVNDQKLYEENFNVIGNSLSSIPTLNSEQKKSTLRRQSFNNDFDKFENTPKENSAQKKFQSNRPIPLGSTLNQVSKEKKNLTQYLNPQSKPPTSKNLQLKKNTFLAQQSNTKASEGKNHSQKKQINEQQIIMNKKRVPSSPKNQARPRSSLTRDSDITQEHKPNQNTIPTMLIQHSLQNSQRSFQSQMKIRKQSFDLKQGIKILDKKSNLQNQKQKGFLLRNMSESNGKIINQNGQQHQGIGKFSALKPRQAMMPSTKSSNINFRGLQNSSSKKQSQNVQIDKTKFKWMNIKMKQGSVQNLKPLIKFNPDKVTHQSPSSLKFKQAQQKNTISPQNYKMNQKQTEQQKSQENFLQNNKNHQFQSLKNIKIYNKQINQLGFNQSNEDLQNNFEIQKYDQNSLEHKIYQESSISASAVQQEIKLDVPIPSDQMFDERVNEISSSDEDFNNQEVPSDSIPNHANLQSQVKMLHNIPKISGSNLLIKCKAQINSYKKSEQPFQFQTLQRRSQDSQSFNKNSQIKEQSVNGQKKYILLKIKQTSKKDLHDQGVHLKNQIHTRQKSNSQQRLQPQSVQNFPQNNKYYQTIVQPNDNPIVQSGHSPIKKNDIIYNSLQANLNSNVNQLHKNTIHMPLTQQNLAITQHNINSIQNSLNKKINQKPQNIQFSQKSLIQNKGVYSKNMKSGNEDNEENHISSASGFSGGGTNCNVTATLTHISSTLSGQNQMYPAFTQTQNLNSILQSKQKISEGQYRLSSQSSFNKTQQINRLPNSTQKFSQPMKIIQIKKF